MMSSTYSTIPWDAQLPGTKAGVPQVKPLHRKLGIDCNDSDLAKRFTTEVESLRRNEKTTTGIAFDELHNWDSRVEQQGLAEAACRFLDKHGQTFWPDDRASMDYNGKLQLSTHRKEIGSLLHQLIYKKNGYKSRNDKSRALRNEAENTAGTPKQSGKAANRRRNARTSDLRPYHVTHPTDRGPTLANSSSVYDVFDSQIPSPGDSSRPRAAYPVMRADSVADEGSQYTVGRSPTPARPRGSDDSRDTLTSVEEHGPEENDTARVAQTNTTARPDQTPGAKTQRNSNHRQPTGFRNPNTWVRRTLRETSIRERNDQASPEEVARCLASPEPDESPTQQGERSSKRKRSSGEVDQQNKRRTKIFIKKRQRTSHSSGAGGPSQPALGTGSFQQSAPPSVTVPTMDNARAYHEAAASSAERDRSNMVHNEPTTMSSFAPATRNVVSHEDRREMEPYLSLDYLGSRTPPPTGDEPDAETLGQRIQSSEHEAIPNLSTRLSNQATCEDEPDEEPGTSRAQTTLAKEVCNPEQRLPGPEPRETIESPHNATPSDGGARHQAAGRPTDTDIMPPPPRGPLALKSRDRLKRLSTHELGRESRALSVPVECTRERSTASTAWNPSPPTSPQSEAPVIQLLPPQPCDTPAVAPTEQEAVVTPKEPLPPQSLPSESPGTPVVAEQPPTRHAGHLSASNQPETHPGTDQEYEWAYIVQTRDGEIYAWDPQCSFEELTLPYLTESVMQATGFDLNGNNIEGVSITLAGPGIRAPGTKRACCFFRVPRGQPDTFKRFKKRMQQIASLGARRSRMTGVTGVLEYELTIEALTDELIQEQRGWDHSGGPNW